MIIHEYTGTVQSRDMPLRRPPGLSVSCAGTSAASGAPKQASFKFSGSGTFSVIHGKNGSFKVSLNSHGGLTSPLGKKEFPGLTLHQIETLRTLGCGSSGAVKLARHRPTGRLLALKILNGVASRETRHLLVNELRVLCKLAHPNLVPYYDCFQLDGVAFLALKYMSGGSLEHCCHRYHALLKDSEGLRAPQELSQLPGGMADAPRGLPEVVLASVAMQTLCGLAHLHAQALIHLDLKLANVLIDSFTGVVALADFGIAKDVRHEELRQASCFVGTAAYMAPERLTGQAYSSSADMWSLGMMLLTAAQGSHPWEGAVAVRSRSIEPSGFR